MSVVGPYTIGITVDEFHRVSSFMLVPSFDSVKRLSWGIVAKESFNFHDGHTFTCTWG